MSNTTQHHAGFQAHDYRAAVEESTTLRPHYRAVLSCLIKHADTDGRVAGVSSIALAEAAGIAQGRAVEIVHSLQRRGWLTVHSGRLLGRGNVYTLTPGGGAL